MEDFVLTYLPLHGLGLGSDGFLRYWDILVWVEGVIYELDELNEAAAGAGTLDPPPAFGTAVTALRGVLEQQGLLTPGVQAELAAGLVYWRAERRIAAAMREHPVAPPGGHAILTAEDVESCSAGKSFDYRLLNHLVYALRKREPSQQLLDFLRVDERLVDISDDLVDYEDDVERGSFNLLRCYVHLHGRDAPLKLADLIGQLEGRRERLLAALPAEQREHIRQRQGDAAVNPEALRWQIPDLILDEEAYRSEL